MPDGLAMTPVDRAQRYLLYGSERYALAILRPVQEAIRARGDEAAWFFDGPGAEDLVAGERLLSVSEVRAWDARAVITPSNAVPHFFPGVKVETFHGFDAGKPRHIYIRGFFDLYCTTGPRDTVQFQALADLGEGLAEDLVGACHAGHVAALLDHDDPRLHHHQHQDGGRAEPGQVGPDQRGGGILRQRGGGEQCQHQRQSRPEGFHR